MCSKFLATLCVAAFTVPAHAGDDVPLTFAAGKTFQIIDDYATHQKVSRKCLGASYSGDQCELVDGGPIPVKLKDGLMISCRGNITGRVGTTYNVTSCRLAKPVIYAQSNGDHRCGSYLVVGGDGSIISCETPSY